MSETLSSENGPTSDRSLGTLESTTSVPRAALRRYNLPKGLKTSAGTFEATKTYYRQAAGQVQELGGTTFGQVVQDVADKFFDIDGLTSRTLMPYPHDPFREPAPWKKYDHLTVRERLDQLDLPSLDKEYFESTVNSFGSAPGSQIGFIEALRWYALGGHNMAQVFELAGIYKLGRGGMTTFARSILQDTRCDILLDTVISEIISDKASGGGGGGGGGVVKAQQGQLTLRAKAIVSTVPLNCLGDVKFTPELSPLRREAIAHGHINKGAKIHFKLARPEPGWFAACNGYGDSPFCFSFSDHNGTKASGGPDGTYCIGFGYNDHLKDPRDSATIVGEFKRNLRPGTDVVAYDPRLGERPARQGRLELLGQRLHDQVPARAPKAARQRFLCQRRLGRWLARLHRRCARERIQGRERRRDSAQRPSTPPSVGQYTR